MENAEEEVVEANLNFVSCVAWIRRGVAKLNPEKVGFLLVDCNQQFMTIFCFTLG